MVIVGAVAGIVAMVRSRRQDEDDFPPFVPSGRTTPPAPGWTVGPDGRPAPTGGGGTGAGGGTGPTGAIRSGGDFGLLSGQEPELLSGRGGPDALTQIVGPPVPEALTQYIAPATPSSATAGVGPTFGAGPGIGGDAGPSAGRSGAQAAADGLFTHRPPDQTPPIESTQSWSPDFAEDEDRGSAAAAPTVDPSAPRVESGSTQTWVPEFTADLPPLVPRSSEVLGSAASAAPAPGPAVGGRRPEDAQSETDHHDRPGPSEPPEDEPPRTGRHHRVD